MFLAQINPWIASAIVINMLVFVVGMAVLLACSYKKTTGGDALLRTGQGGTRVSFSGIIVIPVLQHLERIDITVKQLTYERKGRQSLCFRDGTFAELVDDVFVRINRSSDDVLVAVSSYSKEKLANGGSLKDHLSPRFHEAIESVAQKFDFPDRPEFLAHFREAILMEIGQDLHGLVLDDLALHQLNPVAGQSS